MSGVVRERSTDLPRACMVDAHTALVLTRRPSVSLSLSLTVLCRQRRQLATTTDGRGPHARASMVYCNRTSAVVAAMAGAVTALLSCCAAAGNQNIIPFPTPLAPAIGRFHTLRSLQCELWPPHETLDLSTNNNRRTVKLPRGRGACKSPVVGVLSLAQVSVPENGWIGALKDFHLVSLSHARGLRSLSRRPVVSQTRTVPRKAKQWWGSSPAPELHFESELVGMLGARLNTIAGEVRHVTNDWDVITVSRVSAGVCADSHCDSSLIAVNVSAVSSSPSVPILTYPVAREAPNAGLLLSETALLSIGRGVLADPAWLGSTTLSSRLTSEMHLHVEAGNVAGNLDVPLELRTTPWHLNDTSHGARTKASSWIQMLAYVLCEHPRSIIARSHHRLCKDVPDRDKTVEEVNPFKDVDSLPPPQLRVPVAGRNGQWYIHPLNKGTSDLSECKTDDYSRPWMQPAWSAGVGDREINVDSVEEQKLATDLSTCLINFNSNSSWGSSGEAIYVRTMLGTRQDNFGTVHEMATALSQTYDRAVWNVDAPPEPASRIELFLSVLATLFQDWVLLGYVFHPRDCFNGTRRGERKKLADVGLSKGRAQLMFVTLVELASLGNLFAIAWREVQGSRWRAASIRNELAAEKVHSESSYFHQGNPVYETETLFIGARTGYRVPLVVTVAAVTVSLHLVLLVVAWLRNTKVGRNVSTASRNALCRRWQPGGGRGDAAGATKPLPDGAREDQLVIVAAECGPLRTSTASSASSVDTDEGRAATAVVQWGGRREMVVPPTPIDVPPLRLVTADADTGRPRTVTA